MSMDQLLTKLKGYLSMEEELPFAEFQEFYSEFIKVLAAEFDSMSNDDRVKGRYVCQIVASNAQARAGKNRSLTKKFRKISEKCTFWLEAIDYRLGKEGLSKQEIESMTEAVEKSLEDADAAADGSSSS